MARIEKSIEIELLPKNVWSFLSVPSNLLTWLGTIHDIELIEEKAEGIGTLSRATIGKMEFIMEVVEYVENRKISTRAVAGDLKNFSQSFALDPTQKGTRLLYTIEYNVPKILGGKILDAIIVKRVMEEEMVKGLIRLKEFLEKEKALLEKAMSE